MLFGLNPKPCSQRGGPDFTDCHGGLTAANWSIPNTPHPVSYRPADLTPDMCAAPCFLRPRNFTAG